MKIKKKHFPQLRRKLSRPSPFLFPNPYPFPLPFPCPSPYPHPCRPLRGLQPLITKQLTDETFLSLSSLFFSFFLSVMSEVRAWPSTSPAAAKTRPTTMMKGVCGRGTYLRPRIETLAAHV